MSLEMKTKPYKKAVYSYIREYDSRWGDMDGLRHLNHAIYLTFMETARVDFYAHIGLPIERWDSDQSSILASMKVDYFQQVYHPVTLEIGQRVTRIGNSSFDILTGVFRKGEDDPVAQSLFTLVSFNYKHNIPEIVPDEIRKWLKPID